MLRSLAAVVFLCLGAPVLADTKPAPRSMPYRDLTGRAEEFRFVRMWRSYYWREDFTFVLRTDDGRTIRVISREPTPWTDLRLGTTYTDLKVDWKSKPRVQVIGVAAIDRIPEEFPGLKLDKANTVTAFIVRVETEKDGKKQMGDYFVNNWFHRWGADADRKMLTWFAGKGEPYTVYGYLGSNLAPVDKAGQAIIDKNKDEYPGMIYHARVVKADNPVGYELQLIHLMGRSKKDAAYRIFYGDPKKIAKLDGKGPKK
jgi:hypothetical protein